MRPRQHNNRIYGEKEMLRAIMIDDRILLVTLLFRFSVCTVVCKMHAHNANIKQGKSGTEYDSFLCSSSCLQQQHIISASTRCTHEVIQQFKIVISIACIYMWKHRKASISRVYPLFHKRTYPSGYHIIAQCVDSLAFGLVCQELRWTSTDCSITLSAARRMVA